MNSNSDMKQLRCPVCSSGRVKRIYSGRDSVVARYVARGGFRVIKIRGLIQLFSLRYCLRHSGWTIQGPSARNPFPISLGDMLVIARKEVFHKLAPPAQLP